ncbi:toxin-antitoxin system, toxin component domain protein [Cooperia oncophora]
MVGPPYCLIFHYLEHLSSSLEGLEDGIRAAVRNSGYQVRKSTVFLIDEVNLASLGVQYGQTD